MTPLLPMLLLAALWLAPSPAQARSGDEQEAPWVGIVERIESCLAEARPLMTAGQRCIGVHTTPCLRWPESQTTAGMERCHLDEYRAWDVLLNAYFRARPPGPRGDALQEVQRAWLTYRDRHCAYFRTHYAGGSMARSMGAQCMAETTARRAIELRFFRAEGR